MDCAINNAGISQRDYAAVDELREDVWRRLIAINLTGVIIVAFQAGWYGDLHPVPRPQWIMVMTGAVEVEVSDREKRTFTASTAESFAYLDDIRSKGHIIRTVGDELSIVMVAEVD